MISGESKVYVAVLNPVRAVSTTPRAWFCDVPLGVRQFNDVVLIQSVFSQMLPPTNAVGELPSGPKFEPIRVTVLPVFAGPLVGATKVMTGVSNVKLLAIVPIEPSREMVVCSAPPVPACNLQVTCEFVMYVVVMQAVPPIVPDSLKSTTPKLKPLIETIDPAVLAALPRVMAVATGESYENKDKPVPMVLNTSATIGMDRPLPCLDSKQDTAVGDIQDDVPHCVTPNLIVREGSTLAKFDPKMVMDSVVVVAALVTARLVTIGESYEKDW